MKRRWMFVTPLAVMVVVFLSVGCGGATETTTSITAAVEESGGGKAAERDHEDHDAHSHGPDLAAGPLSEDEEEALIFLREEEKLAHDVYTVLYEEWGIPVFDNIAASETRHMASMKELLDNYGLADPIGDNGIGVFDNAELQELYDALVSQGSVSKAEALKVGIAVETKDIEDLEQLIDITTHSDIRDVAQNLLKASQNHLAAFSKVR